MATLTIPDLRAHVWAIAQAVDAARASETEEALDDAFNTMYEAMLAFEQHERDRIGVRSSDSVLTALHV